MKIIIYDVDHRNQRNIEVTVTLNFLSENIILLSYHEGLCVVN